MTGRGDSRGWRSAVPALPALVAVALVLGAGVGATVLQSVGLVPLVGTPQLSFAGYRGAQEELLTAAGLSLLIATASTLLAALVGVTAALLLVGASPASRVLSALVATSLPIPHLVGAASMGLLLSDTGLASRWLGSPPEAWPSLVAGRWPTAVILEYAWKESAFVTLVVSATLATRLSAFHETAALLGAGPWARLRHVSLPLAAPALMAASAIAFVYTLGSYEVAWLLGAAYPEPLPVMSYRLFTSTDLGARPEAMAVAVATTALAGTVAVVALAGMRRMGALR